MGGERSSQRRSINSSFSDIESVSIAKVDAVFMKILYSETRQPASLCAHRPSRIG